MAIILLQIFSPKNQIIINNYLDSLEKSPEKPSNQITQILLQPEIIINFLLLIIPFLPSKIKYLLSSNYILDFFFQHYGQNKLLKNLALSK